MTAIKNWAIQSLLQSLPKREHREGTLDEKIANDALGVFAIEFHW